VPIGNVEFHVVILFDVYDTHSHLLGIFADPARSRQIAGLHAPRRKRNLKA
jgi:hypothetical protein